MSACVFILTVFVLSFPILWKLQNCRSYTKYVDWKNSTWKPVSLSNFSRNRFWFLFWFATEGGNLDVTYTHNEGHASYCHSFLFISWWILVLCILVCFYEPFYQGNVSNNGDIFCFLLQGVLALFGMNVSEGKPILLCSCNDNSVRLYELPSWV